MSILSQIYQLWLSEQKGMKGCKYKPCISGYDSNAQGVSMVTVLQVYYIMPRIVVVVVYYLGMSGMNATKLFRIVPRN